MRGATYRYRRKYDRSPVSIHAPRAGRDLIHRQRCLFPYWFQSTRPVRGATWTEYKGEGVEQVSIHAPRAGRDLFVNVLHPCCVCFNPRAPCGARQLICFIFYPAARFNPRAPCGARPAVSHKDLQHAAFQSTRPVRGATRGSTRRPASDGVSIHAPRAGRDSRRLWIDLDALTFQSTRPVRGATLIRRAGNRAQGVSIHAPRAGRDRKHAALGGRGGRFNPRAPCGARPRMLTTTGRKRSFNPRAPCGARPLQHHSRHERHDVSIHAPRAGRDSRRRAQRFISHVSIHAPRAGRDGK